MKLFDEFGDMKVREIKFVEDSTLEKILKIEEEIIKEYEQDERFKKYRGEHKKAYPSLCQLTHKKIEDIPINNLLLQEYIDARDNSKKNTQALIRGMYSAALLELSCIQNKNEQIMIDGHGKTFNYLFHHVKNASNVLVQNFKGDGILQKAGINEGKIENITCINITGNDLLFHAGKNKGNAKSIICSDITGNDSLLGIGSNDGNTKHIIVKNVKGERTLYDMGIESGSAEYITCIEIIGAKTLSYAGNWGGKIEYLTFQKGEGNLNFSQSKLRGNSEKCILNEKFLTIKQKSILYRIEKIVDTMHTLPYSEQKNVHDEIAQLQKEIFAGET